MKKIMYTFMCLTALSSSVRYSLSAEAGPTTEQELDSALRRIIPTMEDENVKKAQAIINNPSFNPNLQLGINDTTPLTYILDLIKSRNYAGRLRVGRNQWETSADFNRRIEPLTQVALDLISNTKTDPNIPESVVGNTPLHLAIHIIHAEKQRNAELGSGDLLLGALLNKSNIDVLKKNNVEDTALETAEFYTLESDAISALEEKVKQESDNT